MTTRRRRGGRGAAWEPARRQDLRAHRAGGALGGDVARLATDAIGRTVSVEDLDPAEQRRRFVQYGVPEWVNAALEALYLDYRASGANGYAARITEDVSRSSGPDRPRCGARSDGGDRYAPARCLRSSGAGRDPHRMAVRVFGVGIRRISCLHPKNRSFALLKMSHLRHSVGRASVL
jgi:hypothetical protein